MKSRSQAACLAFALFVICTGVNLHVPLYAVIAQQDGRGVMATTIAFSFYVAGILPVLLALGGLSDRIGRRRVILISLALSAIGTVLMWVSPHINTLAFARWLLGAGTALMSATATAYMTEIMTGKQTGSAANWVTASTSVGFGLGPALTALTLMSGDSLAPPSYWLHLAGTAIAALILMSLPARPTRVAPMGSMLRLPSYPDGALWFGSAILLAWATTGLIISILPTVLAYHGLSRWSGVATLLAISCGLLFQPAARARAPVQATSIGLIALLPAYGLLGWGAVQGQLVAVLLGALLASSACYGFVYLGGLAGVSELADGDQARVSAGFFLMAYLGFSVPVIFTGFVADAFGRVAALGSFGVLLMTGILVLLACQKRLSPHCEQHTMVRP